MTLGSPYNPQFYNSQRDGAYEAAKVVLPRLIELCQPGSVADFGCGVGSWTRAFLELGIDATGVDGAWVRNEMLVIPKDHFIQADLTQPVDLKRTFDLVISLEVAEHLRPATASIFVDTLTAHGKVVLFSAAIPDQGGTDHVNEQWPQYWARLFSEKGYRCLDCLRDVFWEDQRIEWWYRQNMLLFVSNDVLSGNSKLAAEGVRSCTLPLAIVHPELFREVASKGVGLKRLLKQFPDSFRVSFDWHRRRFGRPSG